MMRNFLYDIAGCKGEYRMDNREESALNEIRRIVGADQKVLVCCEL